MLELVDPLAMFSWVHFFPPQDKQSIYIINKINTDGS